MVKATSQVKRENAEARLYELLGVRAFRKFLFRLESVKHRRDGGKNPNYHLRNCSLSALESHKGYILYNSCIHVVSLCISLCYFLSARRTGRGGAGPWIITALLVVFNGYCLMLQRYALIKLQAHIRRRKKITDKKTSLLCQGLAPKLTGGDRVALREEYDRLCRIEKCLDQGETCILDRQDGLLLSRTGALLRSLAAAEGGGTGGGVAAGGVGAVGGTDGTRTVGEMIDAFSDKPAVIGGVERITSALQRMLGTKAGHNVLYGATILTSCPDSEKAYRELFPTDSRERMEWVLKGTMEAYRIALSREKGARHADE